MNYILKYLSFVLFGIIIYLLLKNICKKERFSIGGQITTNCNSKNMYDRIMDVQNHYDSSGSVPAGDNQVHRIPIKEINGKKYQEIVVLTQNVKDFLYYNSSFERNIQNFNINISRLLNRIHVIISNICQHDNMNPYLDYILSGYYDSENNFFPCQDVDNYGCLYIYLDDSSVKIFNNDNDSKTSPLSSESPCDICQFRPSSFVQPLTQEDGRNICDEVFEFVDANKPQAAIALSDLYYYKDQDPSFSFRPFEQPALIHEFAHIILEYGVVKSNSSKRIDFNCIYDHYKDYVDLHVNPNAYGVSGGTCDEIYACYGNCSRWSIRPISCLYKGRELFAMASETWFGVNNTRNNAGEYLDNILNLLNRFPDLYKYLESIYGPPNNLCIKFGNTEFNHYHVCDRIQASQGSIWTDVGDIEPSIISSLSSQLWGYDDGASSCQESCSLKPDGKYYSQTICNCNCERSQAPDWAGFMGVTGATAAIIGAMACAARRKRYTQLDTSQEVHGRP